MGADGFDVVDVSSPNDVDTVAAQLRSPRDARFVMLLDPRVGLTAVAGELLIAAAGAPMAATASPVPVRAAGDVSVVGIDLDPGLPPAPSLPFACARCCLVSVDALESVPLPEPRSGDDVAAWFGRVCDRLIRAGWRHVAAPGTALAWSLERPDRASPESIWSKGAINAVTGFANEGLSTHRLWARTRLQPVRVAVDGACVTDGRHNGSQSVVIEVARALTRRRPGAEVTLAVEPAHIGAARAAVGPEVEVVERGHSSRRFDIVYRPYQLLDPHEAAWIEGAGDRVMLGQLDMIGFSNPTYHPSPALFHAVRNLQRSMMRRADAVTFISAFGRDTAVAECPDLDPERLFVVSCGADPRPPEDELAADVPPLVTAPFVACLSATFWHKNRRHAIAVFDDLCRRHGYEGSLVLAGPEPYYGRSADDERELTGSLEPAIAERVLRLGLVDETSKWWLLQHADLVLYPSVIEGFGLVPFEAAAVGTPTLSYRGSAIAEVLGVGPASVPTWSATEWSDSAARLLADPTATSELLEQVRAAQECHTWDAVGELTWAAIDRTLARARVARFEEEGAYRSRVSGRDRAAARWAPPTHFLNRLISYTQRRVGSWRTPNHDQ